LTLERQGKWEEAENVWREAVKRRETMKLTTLYWDALKEMAAFYARRGDLHAAADIARRVEDSVADKALRPASPMPYLVHSRPWSELYNGKYDG